MARSQPLYCATVNPSASIRKRIAEPVLLPLQVGVCGESCVLGVPSWSFERRFSMQSCPFPSGCFCIVKPCKTILKNFRADIGLTYFKIQSQLGNLVGLTLTWQELVIIMSFGYFGWLKMLYPERPHCWNTKIKSSRFIGYIPIFAGQSRSEFKYVGCRSLGGTSRCSEIP